MIRVAFLFSCLILSFSLACEGERSASEIADGDEAEAPKIEYEQHFLDFETDFQTGFYNETVSLSLRAADADGQAIENATIKLQILEGEGYSSAKGAVFENREDNIIRASDGNGIVTMTLTLGETSGLVIVEARSVVGEDEVSGLSNVKAELATPILSRVWCFHPKDETHKPLHILAINDFHMRMLPEQAGKLSLGGLARIATIFKEIRAMNDQKGISTLIVNTGDDMENTLFHNAEEGIVTLYEIYDRIGVDVTQVGNHDYHFGIPFLDEQIEKAQPSFTEGSKGHKMHFLWGNVKTDTLYEPYRHYAPLFEENFADTDDSARYNQSVTLPMDGFTIGLFGATTDAAIYTQVAGAPAFYRMIGAPMEYSQGLTFVNPDPRESDYIARGIDSLNEEGADTIILASHAGLGFGDRVNIPPGKDEWIARYGIGRESERTLDLILSAHSHVQLNHPIFVDNPKGTKTPLVQAKEAGAFVAAVQMEIDPTSNDASVVDAHLIQVDQSIKEDEAVGERIAELKAKIEAEHGAVFTTTIAETDIHLSSQQRSQSGLGQLIAEAFLWKLGEEGVDCDATMATPSMYRADLFPEAITPADAYDIMPLHNLDDEGMNDEPLVYWELSPGLYDFSIFSLPDSKREGITVVEYILETVYSLELLDQIYPGASTQFKIEVMHLAGVQYKLDYDALPFHRLVAEELKIGGEPIDPAKTYRLAMAHSIGANLGYILNFIITAKNAETGESTQPFNVQPVTDAPFVDTGVLGWVAVKEFFEQYLSPADEACKALLTIDGSWFRSVQPDVTTNPYDIRFSDDAPKAGDSIEITVGIRNLGDVPVEEALVRVYLESTPWNLTDNDDGRLTLEGFSESFTGSLRLIDEKRVTLGAWPDMKDVSFDWEIPATLPRYDYPIVVRIEETLVTTENPQTGNPFEEVIQGNNGGPDQSRLLRINSFENSQDAR